MSARQCIVLIIGIGGAAGMVAYCPWEVWLFGMYAVFLAVRPKQPDDKSSAADQVSTAHPDLMP